MTTNFNYNHLAELVGNVVDQKIISLHELFVQENAKLRQDLLEKMSQLEQTMNGKMDDLENKLNGKMDNLESTLNNQMNNLDKTLNGRVDNLESTLNNKIASIQNQLTSKIDSAISDMNNKIIQATASIIKFDNVVAVSPTIANNYHCFIAPSNANKFFYYSFAKITTTRFEGAHAGTSSTVSYVSTANLCSSGQRLNIIFRETGATRTSVTGTAYFFW